MRPTVVFFTLLFFAIASCAVADTFGNGANTFTIPFIPIGDLNNPADTTGSPNPVGAVSYSYRLGQFEVSEDMIAKANALGGLGISVDSRGLDKPATSITWNEAARFVNWLNASNGSIPAYKFANQPGQVGYSANDDILLWSPGDPGYNANNLYRNSLAQYFLPSVDEWYKAVYYDPASNSYFNYGGASDTTPPTPVASGQLPHTAVYEQDLAAGPANINFAGGLDTYGTMGQMGNVAEWLETAFDVSNNSAAESRGIRGGYWAQNASSFLSTSWINAGPGAETNTVGFRIASVPEPSMVLLFAIGCFLLSWKTIGGASRSRSR
jgi:hypothetical protein